MPVARARPRLTGTSVLRRKTARLHERALTSAATGQGSLIPSPKSSPLLSLRTTPLSRPVSMLCPWSPVRTCGPKRHPRSVPSNFFSGLCTGDQGHNIDTGRESGVVRSDSKGLDRKSTRLNSSHGYISYAVFCLKKKKKEDHIPSHQ